MKLFLIGWVLAQDADAVFTAFVQAIETFDRGPEFRRSLYEKVYAMGEFCRTAEYNAELKKRYEAFRERLSKEAPFRVDITARQKIDDGTLKIEGSQAWEDPKRSRRIDAILEKIEGRWRVREYRVECPSHAEPCGVCGGMKAVPFEPFPYGLAASPKEEMKPDLSTPKAAAQTCLQALVRESSLPADTVIAQWPETVKKLQSMCTPALIQSLQGAFDRARKEAAGYAIASVEEKGGQAVAEFDSGPDSRERLILTRVEGRWLMSKRQATCSECKKESTCEYCRGSGWRDY